jgi:hypothetical protein
MVMQMLDSSNWGVVSAFASVTTLVGTVGIGGMMWGKLTERVSNITKRVDLHRDVLDTHERCMNEIKRKQERLLEWKEEVQSKETS